jgi:formylglycine-generating enzyme required for sulfatase activity
VPGGSFYRSYDGVTVIPPYIDYTSKAYPATVSDFRLDKYEVTVRQFRKFVAVYAPNMTPPGAGKNPNNPDDPGWDTAWNAELVTGSVLLGALKCASAGRLGLLFSGDQTWTDVAGIHEEEPINCVSWYEAFAFCAWDGGWLPTEAEWNYAAAGGSEQRMYPWGSETPDCTRSQNSSSNASCGLRPAKVGGVSPAGDGRWGQADLAGNVEEFTRDLYTDSYAQVACTNCAKLAQPQALGWVARGGAFGSVPRRLLSSFRDEVTDRSAATGIRCARSP